MTRYLDLAEYLWLAEQVTGIHAEVLARSSRLALAESALHAAAASHGGIDFYPDLVDKAAILCWRLTRNHPLPEQQAGRVGGTRHVRRPERWSVGSRSAPSR